MKLALSMILALVALAGCGSKTKDDVPAQAGSGAPAGTGAAGFAVGGGKPGAAPAGGAESFFAGDVPAGVTFKPTKTFAIAPGILLMQGIEGWSGGQLPGYEYMTMSKDTRAVARVTTSTGVTNEMGCKELGTAAAMAPLRAKNLKETAPATLRKVGKNKFVAREGACSGDGPKGPVEIHFIDILRKDNEGFWHYAVIVGYPPDAPPELKNEAKAWSRSIEFNGVSGYTMP